MISILLPTASANEQLRGRFAVNGCTVDQRVDETSYIKSKVRHSNKITRNEEEMGPEWTRTCGS